MKVAILAGGAGSRLAEETQLRPKPMVEIGGMPILWHIMEYYAHYGFKDFVIALGYKGEIIKEYFERACQSSTNLKIDFASGEIEREFNGGRDWSVSLIETGLVTMTGGRIKRLAPYLDEGTFLLTWGDGLSDVNLTDLLAFHRSHGKLATLTAVHPPARYGHLSFEGDRVTDFTEKPQTKEGWINGAFFVLEPGIFDYIEGDETQWEREPLQALARDGQLMAYKHTSFWQCMDTLREKYLLERLWASGAAPWKVWD
ncbi:MAG: glucose-1-phosphate cytidylyltransferase [Alphaproteobacteria bacterium]|nr:glucose-1-phosphate cytidylyltransferase [Alphaproteobacteria bacterium]